MVWNEILNPLKTSSSASAWADESWNETNARTTSKGETRAGTTKLHNSGYISLELIDFLIEISFQKAWVKEGQFRKALKELIFINVDEA